MIAPRSEMIRGWIASAWLLALSWSSQAQPPYTLEPDVVSTGALPQQSANGYTLNGTIGQPGLANVTANGGVRAESGFWRALDDRIFADGFNSSGP